MLAYNNYLDMAPPPRLLAASGARRSPPRQIPMLRPERNSLMKKTVFALLVVVMAACAFALPKYLATFTETYKIKKDSNIGKARCTVCHVASSKKLNPFGQQVSDAMMAAQAEKVTPEVLKAVEKLDADKDGVTNGDAIKADKLPYAPVKKSSD